LNSALVQSIDYLHPQRAPPERQIWFRAVDALGDDEMLHRRLLAYVRIFSCSIPRPCRTAPGPENPLW